MIKEFKDLLESISVKEVAAKTAVVEAADSSDKDSGKADAKDSAKCECGKVVESINNLVAVDLIEAVESGNYSGFISKLKSVLSETSQEKDDEQDSSEDDKEDQEDQEDKDTEDKDSDEKDEKDEKKDEKNDKSPVKESVLSYDYTKLTEALKSYGFSK